MAVPQRGEARHVLVPHLQPLRPHLCHRHIHVARRPHGTPSTSLTRSVPRVSRCGPRTSRGCPRWASTTSRSWGATSSWCLSRSSAASSAPCVPPPHGGTPRITELRRVFCSVTDTVGELVTHPQTRCVYAHREPGFTRGHWPGSDFANSIRYYSLRVTRSPQN